MGHDDDDVLDTAASRLCVRDEGRVHSESRYNRLLRRLGARVWDLGTCDYLGYIKQGERSLVNGEH